MKNIKAIMTIFAPLILVFILNQNAFGLNTEKLVNTELYM